MQMIPIIADTAFNKLGVIDDYISFIWTTRYYTPGDFELCVDISEKNLSMIQKDYYVFREDDTNVGIIERIEIRRDEDGHEMLIVSGRFLSSILGRRIIAVQTQVYGQVPACISTLLSDNIINPDIDARQIPYFYFTSDVSNAPTMRQQFTGDNLLTAIENICKNYGYGFRIVLANANQRKVFLFIIYSGIDRSRNQSVNPWVVFSDEYDNLLSSDYIEQYKNIVTDVLVAGEGEGTDRKTIWASKTNESGLNRYELYKDARNASTNGGEISDADYYAQLEQTGLESVTTITQAFSGQVYFGSVNYKTDIDIGDICVIENARWGISINTRLIEVIESVSETGEYTITPTFGV